MQEAFRKFSMKCADTMGTSWSFFLALILILLWGLSGPYFHYSDTWQLIINTSTTVITFLMVFLIQNTQNRDAKVIQLKLDELLRAVEGARTQLVSLENFSDDELMQLQKEFERLHKRFSTPPKLHEATTKVEIEKAEIHGADLRQADISQVNVHEASAASISNNRKDDVKE